MLTMLERELDANFNSDASIPELPRVKPDAIDLENKIVVEAYARIGPLKGAQKHKVKGDILKLALIGETLGPSWRLIYCFASHEAAKYARGDSWVARAALHFQVEITVVDLGNEQKQNVIAAQKRQIMVNSSP